MRRQKKLKKLTILHSNDMHGDFLAEKIDEKLVGGVSLLSGYVNKVRREEKNVIYAIAGDMFRGSVIDSEDKGTSTIGIMNLVGPDVATIGNHEVDYGLAHLLFLEKCADFPIINANLHIKSNGKRMFQPYWIARIDGMKEFQIYSRIIAPLAKPAFVTLGIFHFMNNWNDLLYPMMLTSSVEMRTLSAGLAVLVGSNSIKFGPTLAATVISIAPLLILFLFGQRFFMEGIATSGMKE